VLQFDEGITAILGPNGCGKSNIVDAARWVLGEQSAKTLRGDRMEDVIFKGTTKRKPVGMAEVILTFTNEDRGLPIEYDEVAVGRRVTRDGISEYSLNGTVCRLKDLRDLFYDSGVNNTSYSIIEESMIKQILNENNQELRHLLEEGSGITKYKARRKETQRKLERTRQDLLRLDDIVEEIGREVRSLQRQVGKARRYQRLRNEIRTLDIALARRRRLELDDQEHALKDRAEELRTLAETDTGELNELRARVEATRPDLDEREAERRHLEEALQAYDEELQEIERKVLVLEHRHADARRRRQENQSAVAETERRQSEVERQAAGLDERLAILREELGTNERRLGEHEESLAVLEDRVRAQREALDEATQLNLEFIESDAGHKSRLREMQVRRENRQERIASVTEEGVLLRETAQTSTTERDRLDEEHAAKRSERQEQLDALAAVERRLADGEAEGEQLQREGTQLQARREAEASRHEVLQRIQTEHQGYGRGARHVLQSRDEARGVHGALADQLRVPQEHAAALETLLAELAGAVVVDRQGTAVELVEELRGQEEGQASFVHDLEKAAAPTAADPAPAGGRSALEVVTGPAASLPHVRRVLAATWIFASDADAAAAAAAHAGEYPIGCLSRSGLLVTSDGVVRGGQARPDETGLIGREERLTGLAESIVELDRRLTRQGERVAANREARDQARAALESGRAALEVVDGELQELALRRAQAGDRGAAAEQRVGELEAERERLEGELATLVSDEESLRDQLAESGRQRTDSTERRDAVRQRLVDTEEERDALRAEVEELRLTRQRRDGERRETEAALTHLRETMAELTTRRERLTEEIAHGEQEVADLEREAAEGKERMAEGVAERERRRHIVQAAADRIRELHTETARWHDRINAIEGKRSDMRERSHKVETELATLDIRRNNLEERVEQKYHGRYPDLVASINEEDLPKELEREGEVFQAEQAGELLEDRRGKLAGLGPINHLALEEYETKKERLDFLEGQRADVAKAKEDLEQAIAEINRTARRLFTGTFEEVRRNYVAVFQTLFRGGRANLELLRTDDPLESNIRILAQPTGKVIDHVSLLSGGERCLTALSILFAVYLVKPSPFCMLDEADAPLDDANIGRFVRMLREFSRNTQFLVITHNKLTMETANHL